VRLPEALAPLRLRDFRLLFAGQAVSLLGDGMLGVALSFAVLDLTGSVSDLGYVFAARAVPMVVFLLAGGVFADRLSRRTVMLASDAVRLVAFGVAAALLISGRAEIWELIVVQAVAGIASAFFYPASTGLVPMTVPPEALQQANALRGISLAAGTVAGPALAGVLVATVGPGWAIAADAATYLASVASLAQLRVVRNDPLEVRPFFHDLAEGWREFSSRTWLWAFIAAASLNNLVAAAVPVLGAAIARDELGGPSAWATIVAAGGAGSVVGGFVTLRIRPARPLLTASLLLALLSGQSLALAFVAPVPVIAAAAFLSGLAVMTSNSLFETAEQRHVPAAALSRVSAYDWFGSLTFNPIGFALVGPVAGAIGRKTTLLIPGLWFLVVPLVLAGIPSIRRLGR
jgi:MFS family permease